MKNRYFYYGSGSEPPIPHRYKSIPLPEDINDDSEVLGVMASLEKEPEGKKFNIMIKQFQKNKWYGFVMYSINLREIVKFHFMCGVIIRKEIRMWADGWSFQDLKNSLKKMTQSLDNPEGVLIAIPEAVRSSMNEMVFMKRGQEDA